MTIIYMAHPGMERGEENNRNGTHFFLDTAYVLALLNPHDVYHKHVKVVSVDTALLRRAKLKQITAYVTSI